MYICICGQVTDHQIRQALSNGDAGSLEELCENLGLAQCCGQCKTDANTILENYFNSIKSDIEP